MSSTAKANAARLNGQQGGRPRKYDPLRDWLRRQPGDVCTISLDRLEDATGLKFPMSARTYRPWWGNEVAGTGRQCQAWLDAGWQVESVDLERDVVVFARAK